MRNQQQNFKESISSMVGWLVGGCLVVLKCSWPRSSWWPGGATAPILLNPTNNRQRKQNAESHWKAFLFAMRKFNS